MKKEISFKISQTKAVGTCTYKKHPGYITEQALREHDCIQKNCPFFTKREEADYWHRKEMSKRKREARRLLIQSGELVRTNENNIKKVIEAKEKVKEKGGEQMITEIGPNKGVLFIGNGNEIIGDDIGAKKMVEKYRGSNSVARQICSTVSTAESEVDDLGTRRNKTITGLESGKVNKYADKKQTVIYVSGPKKEETKVSSSSVGEILSIVDELFDGTGVDIVSDIKTEVKAEVTEAATPVINEVTEETGETLTTETAEAEVTEEKTVQKRKYTKRKKVETVQETDSIEADKQTEVELPFSPESCANILLYASIKLGGDVQAVSNSKLLELVSSEANPKFTYQRLLNNNNEELQLVKDYINSELEAAIKKAQLLERFAEIMA